MGAAHVLRDAGRKSRYMFTHTHDRNNDETFCYGTALKRHFLWGNQGMRVVRVREHYSVLGFLLSQKRRRHLRQHQENRRKGRTNMALARPDEHLGQMSTWMASYMCIKPKVHVSSYSGKGRIIRHDTPELRLFTWRQRTTLCLAASASARQPPSSAILSPSPKTRTRRKP